MRNPAPPMDTSPLPVEISEGDCLDVARSLQPGSVDLAYVDPPFFTERAHSGEAGEFGDTWGGDLRTYLQYLGARLDAIWQTLCPEGSLLIHLDWHAVHAVKVGADGLWGRDRFVSEIIWAYNSGGGSRKRYGRRHDNILWYARGKAPCFNADEARVPYSAVIASKRAHLFHPEGKVSGDVLTIPRPPNHAKEWVGFPTQKPLALLTHLVKVHSRPGELVADFFCGSGTTLVAAKALGRRAFGCDLSPAAVEVARRRTAG